MPSTLTTTASEAAEQLGRTLHDCKVILAMPMRTADDVATVKAWAAVWEGSVRQVLEMMFNDARALALFERAGCVVFQLDDPPIDVVADAIAAVLTSQLCALEVLTDLVAESRQGHIEI